jgi:chemotaxis receptor (MCP) glutamine deamidase CheD
MDTGNADDFDAAIEALGKLPSGFSSRNINTSIVYKSDEAAERNRSGMAAYTHWRQSKDSTFLETAAEHFQRAMEISADADDPTAMAQVSLNYALTQTLMNRPKLAIPAFETAIKIYDRHPYSDQLYRSLGGLYGAIFALSREKSIAGHSVEAERLRSQLPPLRKRSLELLYVPRGESYDYDAYRVEQGEIGFSADRKIGTDNVKDCVCVIIHDPITKKTALAHVDSFTDVQSLEEVFKRLPNHAFLKAKLIGARFTPGSEKNHIEQDARKNLQKVVQFLEEKQVEILSAAILDSDQPTSVVVDPVSFELEERSPGMPNPNRDIANAKAAIENSGKSLQVAFDLTVSDQCAPILLPRQAVSNLHRFFTRKSAEEIYDHFINIANNYPDEQLPGMVERIIDLTQAYRRSLRELQEKFDEKHAELRRNGIRVPTTTQTEILDALERCPVHIGEGANSGNKALMDFIENRLFTVEGKTLTTDIDGLGSFAFPSQPYETIEAKHGTNRFQARIANRTRSSADVHLRP